MLYVYPVSTPILGSSSTVLGIDLSNEKSTLQQLMAAADTSSAVASVLASCAALTPAERRAVCAALLSEGCRLEASLAAWSEDTTFVSRDCAPAPGRPSRHVSICWNSGYDCHASVTGCPWCRRPLTVQGRLSEATEAGQLSNLVAELGLARRCAYVTLLYGPQCHAYFLGAVVLGGGLLRWGGSSPKRVLLHTDDGPKAYVILLDKAGWSCQTVEYVKGVAKALFHNLRYSRFVDVFTKLRALELMSFDRILLLDLDLMVRPAAAGDAPMLLDDSLGVTESAVADNVVPSLESLFTLRPPAAMKRGPPVPRHGEVVSYAAVWSHPARRRGDELPPHQQASGINAGVMLFQPNLEYFRQMETEIRDWHHPEHYGTYMPEQEYLGRLFGTFDQWTHIDCCFNFEVDKNERVPHDFTDAHERIRAGGAPGHPGAAVLHFSGTGVKPWDLLFERRGDASSLRVANAAGTKLLLDQLIAEGPGDRLDGYVDVQRLWTAMLEWLSQLVDASDALAADGADVLQAMHTAIREDVCKS